MGDRERRTGREDEVVARSRSLDDIYIRKASCKARDWSGLWETDLFLLTYRESPRN